MKCWHLFAGLSGIIIAVTMALASVSYNATLGTSEPSFRWLPGLTNSMLFASLALAFDFGMVASVFGFLHWRGRSRMASYVCAILFIIASLYSIHSLRGYIALNITKSRAPAERQADGYAALQSELRSDQAYLTQLRAKLLAVRRYRNRIELDRRITRIERNIQQTRERLARTEIEPHISPARGLEWFLALTLWFFNATCWSAWFGYKAHAPITAHDPMAQWFMQHDLTTPQHCRALYDSYKSWCDHKRISPLSKNRFYARLVELGARKFRDGRSGPIKYVMAGNKGVLS